MKLYLKYFALLLILLTQTACPEVLNEPDSELLVLNTSNEDIIIFKNFSLLSDTSFNLIPFPLTSSNTVERIVLSNSSKKFPEPYRAILKRNPNDFLTVFFFHPDTIVQVPWEEIIERESKLRVTQYSLEQLEALDWTITYP